MSKNDAKHDPVTSYTEAVTSATDRLLTREEAAVPPDTTVDPGWRFHMPMLVDAAAGLLAQAGDAFPDSPCSAEELRGEKAQLGRVEVAREACATQLGRLDRAGAYHKNRIVGWIAQLTRAVDAKLADPTLPAATRERVRTAAGPLLAIQAHYQEAAAAAARTTRTFKAQLSEVESAGAVKDLVIRELRGDRLRAEDLSPRPTPPAARTGRRARRTRR